MTFMLPFWTGFPPLPVSFPCRVTIAGDIPVLDVAGIVVLAVTDMVLLTVENPALLAVAVIVPAFVAFTFMTTLPYTSVVPLPVAAPVRITTTSACPNPPSKPSLGGWNTVKVTLVGIPAVMVFGVAVMFNAVVTVDAVIVVVGVGVAVEVGNNVGTVVAGTDVGVGVGVGVPFITVIFKLPPMKPNLLAVAVIAPQIFAVIPPVVSAVDCAAVTCKVPTAFIADTLVLALINPVLLAVAVIMPASWAFAFIATLPLASVIPLPLDALFSSTVTPP